MPIDAQAHVLRRVHDVVAVEVAEGQIGVVVDVDLVARQHSTEPQVAGFTFSVAQEHVAYRRHAIQLATGGGAAGDANSGAETVSVRQPVDLERHGDVPHVVHSGKEHGHAPQLGVLGP